MNLTKIVVSAASLSIMIIAQGCSIVEGTDTSDAKVCDPGARVFCRCADKTPGTKRCRSDSRTYDACVTSTTGECVGGEIEDPMSNEPIEDFDPDAQTDGGATPSAGSLDACPGKATAVKVGTDVVLEGDTTTATEDRRGRSGGACALGAGSKDHVYRLTPSSTGALDVRVQGEGSFSPIAYLRSTCADENAQVSCGAATPAKLSQLKLNVVAGKDYFLFVDGASFGAGAYEATVKLSAGGFCGDGVVSDGEACDDGNKEENDGCSNSCKQVNGNPTSGGTCPGHPVDVWPGQTVTGSGSTSGYGNTWSTPGSSYCGLAGEGTKGTNSYSDHVYSVTPHASGNLVVKIDAPATGPFGNHMIVARRACETIGTETALCANNASIGETETLTIAVEKDKTLFVAIDGGGVTSNKGDYTVSFRLP